MVFCSQCAFGSQSVTPAKQPNAAPIAPFAKPPLPPLPPRRRGGRPTPPARPPPTEMRGEEGRRSVDRPVPPSLPPSIHPSPRLEASISRLFFSPSLPPLTSSHLPLALVFWFGFGIPPALLILKAAFREQFFDFSNQQQRSLNPVAVGLLLNHFIIKSLLVINSRLHSS